MAEADSIPELHALVVQKLSKVFGESRAAELLANMLGDLRLARIESVDDLVRLSDALQRRGGFEATVGAMLGVQAAMRRVAR